MEVGGHLQTLATFTPSTHCIGGWIDSRDKKSNSDTDNPLPLMFGLL